MDREHSCKISSKNSKRLLKNMQKMAGDYFFLMHPVYRVAHLGFVIFTSMILNRSVLIMADIVTALLSNTTPAY